MVASGVGIITWMQWMRQPERPATAAVMGRGSAVVQLSNDQLVALNVAVGKPHAGGSKQEGVASEMDILGRPYLTRAERMQLRQWRRDLAEEARHG